MSLADVCADLAAENETVDAVVAGRAEADWDRPTPAEGWAVRDQISHLAFFDEAAARAINDPDGYNADVRLALADPDRYMLERHLRPGRAMTGGDLLVWWRRARTDLLDGLRGLESGCRLPWAGSTMAAGSFATARLMETWAHGRDVADALGVALDPTDRLRHICHLGVRTAPHAFRTNGLEPPDSPPRVELVAPSGARWSWGDEGTDAVRGPALDFALLVTRRCHRADTDLEATGRVADRFLDIAQAYAGPPGSGRRPRTAVTS